jgi:hypothetical protein
MICLNSLFICVLKKVLRKWALHPHGCNSCWYISICICTDNQDIFGIPVAVKKIKTKSDPKIESHVRRVISLICFSILTIYMDSFSNQLKTYIELISILSSFFCSLLMQQFTCFADSAFLAHVYVKDFTIYLLVNKIE